MHHQDVRVHAVPNLAWLATSLVIVLGCSSGDAASSAGGDTDPDLLTASKPNVCETEFGDVQVQASNEAGPQLTAANVPANFTLTKTKLKDVDVKKGTKTYVATVYSYRAEIDLGTLFTVGLTEKALVDTNIYVACDYTKAASSTKGYATAESAEVDDASAKSLCQTLKSSMDVNGLNPEGGAMSMQGLLPESIAVSSKSSASSLALTTKLKTAGTYTTSGETQGYAYVVDYCKKKLAPSYSPYPSWASTGPSKTPELSLCANPNGSWSYDPGIFWVDVSSASFDMSVNLAPTETTITQGTETKVTVQVPTITFTSLAAVAATTPSVRDAYVAMTSTCGWDKEATDWGGSFGDDGRASACTNLKSSLRTGTSQKVFDQIHVSGGGATLASALTNMLAGISLYVRGAAINTDAKTQITIKGISVDTAKKRLVYTWEAVGC